MQHQCCYHNTTSTDLVHQSWLARCSCLEGMAWPACHPPTPCGCWLHFIMNEHVCVQHCTEASSSMVIDNQYLSGVPTLLLVWQCLHCWTPQQSLTVNHAATGSALAVKVSTGLQDRLCISRSFSLCPNYTTSSSCCTQAGLTHHLQARQYICI